MKFSMTGQENSDLLIQVTACAGLTVFDFQCKWESNWAYQNKYHILEKLIM
jgi:hypothetical protein